MPDNGTSKEERTTKDAPSNDPGVVDQAMPGHGKGNERDTLITGKEGHTAVFNSSLAGLILSSLEGRILSANPAACEMLGYEYPDEMVGMATLELCGEPGRKEEMVERLMKYGYFRNVAGTLKKKDGTLISVLASSVIHKDNAGRVLGVVGSFIDITEQKRTELALLESEEKYRALIDSINDGVYRLNTDGYFTYVNKVIVDRAKFPPETFYTLHFLDVVSPKDHSRVLAYFKRVMGGEQVPPYELDYTTGEGRTRSVEVNTRPIYEGDRVVGLMGISRDITRRKDSERITKVMYEIANAAVTSKDLIELFRSIQDHLGRIIDTSNFFIALYDKETDMITLPYFIDEKDSFTELPAGKTFTAYVIRNDRPVLMTDEDIEELVQAGVVEELGTRPKVWVGVPLKQREDVIGVVVVQSYTDSSRYTEEDFEVLKFVSGQIALSIERKKTEEALKDSEEKFRSLAERLPSMVFINRKGRVVYANARCEEIMGYTKEELYSADFDFLSLVAPESLEVVRANYAQHMKGKETGPYEYRILTKDGRRIDAINNCRLINYEGDTAILGIVTDISMWKKAKEALQKAHDQLEHRVEERTTELKRSNVQLRREIEIRAEAEEALRDSEERYRTLTENIRVGIYRTTPESQGRLVEVNRALVEMFGYDSKEALMKASVESLYYHPREREKFRKQMEKNKLVSNAVYRFRKKDGSLFWGSVTAVAVCAEDGSMEYFDGIIEDVTKRKKAEEEMKRRLMKFKMEEGKLYLVKESSATHSLDVLTELLKAGYRGTMLSRTPAEEFRGLGNFDVELLWLGERSGKSTLPPRVDELEPWLEGQPSKSVIFIDRLDYILSKNGFEKTLAFVQFLRELAYFSEFIAILSLDPAALSSRELTLLEKETTKIKPQERLTIPENLATILKEIYEYNILGIAPSYTQIRQKMEISRPTLRKRIHELIAKGYLVEIVKGRSKCLELTEKGKSLLF